MQSCCSVFIGDWGAASCHALIKQHGPHSLHGFQAKVELSQVNVSPTIHIGLQCNVVAVSPRLDCLHLLSDKRQPYHSSIVIRLAPRRRRLQTIMQVVLVFDAHKLKML